MTPSVAGELSRRTAVMAVGTLLSRLTGFGRVAALAYALGFDRLADTYNLANTTPNIVYELVLGGILSATLVPVFVEHVPRADEESWRAISAVVTTAAVALAALTVVFALAAPWLMHLYTLGRHSPSVADQRAVGTSLMRLFAPQVALYGVATISAALLNARRRFAAPMFAPVLNNLVVIAVLLTLPLVAHDLSLTAVRDNRATTLLLGLGATAGVAAMVLAQLPALRAAGVRLGLVWDPGHPAVRSVIGLSGWTFGLVATNQLALWVTLSLANRREGDVAAYQAAQVFFLLPHGIFAVSVMTALLPDLAQLWMTGDLEGYRNRLSLGLRTTAAMLVPAALGYVVLARPIVSLLLQHGALDAASARTTADVLALLALGLPAFSIYLLLMRAYQAMKDTRTMFVLYLGENGVNVGLALALYPAFGVRGLAAAYAAAYTLGTLGALFHLRRRTQGVDGPRLLRCLRRVVPASLLVATAALSVSALIGGDDGPALLLRVAVAVVSGVSVYALAARVFGIEEVAAFLRLRRETS